MSHAAKLLKNENVFNTLVLFIDGFHFYFIFFYFQLFSIQNIQP